MADWCQHCGLFVPDSFGARVKAARITQGIRGDDLAQYGIRKAWLSRIECGKGKPSVATAKRLARALGVEVDWLMGAERNGAGAKNG